MTKIPMEGTAFCKLQNNELKYSFTSRKKIQHYSLVKSILNFYAINIYPGKENFWGV